MSATAQRLPCRTGAHDVRWSDGAWHYLDSYFAALILSARRHCGSTTSRSGQWRTTAESSSRSGSTQRAPRHIKASLAALYGEGRFLGGHRWEGPHGVYDDTSSGDALSFVGHETITVGGVITYRLDYLAA